MRIWLVRDMEPLPTDPGDRRLMRSAMLCKTLATRGHEVVWITSTFDHYAKRQRAGKTRTIAVPDGYDIQLLAAPGYRRNGSPLRVWHNRCFARAFRRFAACAARRPDIIVTDVPTTETAREAVFQAMEWGIPSVVSIRDLWPDFFGDFLPAAARPLLRPAIAAFERQLGYACRNATSIVGISENYLQWGLDKGGRERGDLDGVVPLGYEPVPTDAAGTAVTADRLRQLGIDPRKRLVSFVGSWGGTADLELVLDVASRLSDLADVEFVLAGDGDGRPHLLARSGRLPNVVAPGWLSATEIGLLLGKSCVGLSPYRPLAPQGLPNKIFEYMAYGVFQISTLQGEAAGLLSGLDIGKTVPPGDAPAMAAAIREALDARSHPQERARIRGEFTARYSAEAVYSGFADRIERLSGGPAGARTAERAGR